MKPTLLLACLPLIAASCGKSDAENFADTFCAEVATCCAQAGIPSNGQVCHLMFSGGSYNATAGKACLAEIKSQSAAGTFCSSGGPSPACDAVFASGSAGHKKPGETCDQDSDCAPSNDGKVTCASQYTGDTWIHKCQVRMRGKAGDGPCLGTQDGDVFSSLGTSVPTDLPSQGYVCDTADGVECLAGTCVALAAIGQTCSYASDCVKSGYCDRNGRCASRIAAGATCTGADDAECVGGYHCPDASPRQCTAKVENGSACASDSMCNSGNCSGTTCHPGGLQTLGWTMLCS